MSLLVISPVYCSSSLLSKKKKKKVTEIQLQPFSFEAVEAKVNTGLSH